MRLPKILLATAAVILNPIGSVLADDLDTFDCGYGVVKLDMTPDQIKLACGSNWVPSYISEHHRTSTQDKTQTDHYEKWMYKFSRTDATHLLIKNGRVVRIFTTP